MQMTRRLAREWAVQMLTAADLNPPTDIPAFIAAYWEQLVTLGEDECGTDGETVRARMKAFAEERVIGVLKDQKDIDAAIVPILDHWDLYRLGTVERAVLRLGVWEIRSSDVPAGVVINEAVDLVNWFASPKSRSLINGVLDKYAKSR